MSYTVNFQEHMFKHRDSLPIGPAHRVLYAVGDIHGRRDLLEAMVEMIAHDLAKTCAESPTVIFLGDYIDRGPDSRGVIETLLRLQTAAAFEVVTLRGNHEQFILSFLAEEGGMLAGAWLDHGGRDTLASYGVVLPTHRLDAEGWKRTAADLAAAMPPSHLAFLQATQMTAVFGDYLFVHAGVRPKIALADQAVDDLLNIRRPFLQTRRPYKDGAVVFGHTIFESPLHETWKIGLDTGAYATGRLTALRIEGGARALLTT